THIHPDLRLGIFAQAYRAEKSIEHIFKRVKCADAERIKSSQIGHLILLHNGWKNFLTTQNEGVLPIFKRPEKVFALLLATGQHRLLHPALSGIPWNAADSCKAAVSRLAAHPR